MWFLSRAVVDVGFRVRFSMRGISHLGMHGGVARGAAAAAAGGAEVAAFSGEEVARRRIRRASASHLGRDSGAASGPPT